MGIEKTQTLLDGGCTPPWDNTAMSGTSMRVTDPIELGDDVSEVSWSVPWTNTGTVVGAFDVEECNNDPGADGSSGQWDSVPTEEKILPTVNNNAGPGMIRARVLGRYCRLVYTNASGTGTLSSPTAQGKLYGPAFS